MKKAMLFIVAFLFTAGAHAATLTLAGHDHNNVSQNVTIPSSDLLGLNYVEGHGLVYEEPWFSSFLLNTDTSTPARIEWTFNPSERFTGAEVGIKIDGEADYIKKYTITDGGLNFSFITALQAGYNYIIDVFSTNELAQSHNYTVTVSAVPVPAALFLLAPALLGLLGLRRKAMKAA